MGKRVDVALIIAGILYIVEFKVRSKTFDAQALDQVIDYALDFKNFHEPSHVATIVPILIPTDASHVAPVIAVTPQMPGLFFPVKCSAENLACVIQESINLADNATLDPVKWEHGRYSPTPTIIEAAMALYRGHSVTEISRSDADKASLQRTSDVVASTIKDSRENQRKSICFVTGVPGAGKTLVGLNIATKYTDKDKELHSVFLSGNGPLVAILREALARDRIRADKEKGLKSAKGEARREVKAFIQNVHHFRDECIADPKPPIEHVALFDEAQRAWEARKLSDFMKRKKGLADFDRSEPDFLISCLDRHNDWAVIVCLVGGGQEIHDGEAGISEWIDSLNRTYPNWDIHISSHLTDSEYSASGALATLDTRPKVTYSPALHLSSSMRSFRAEHVSRLVKEILDLDVDAARQTLTEIPNYPILLSRDLTKAKNWLRSKALGSERYGMVVSSQASRLKPLAIDVKSPMNPIHWFLDGKDDVRSSYYLEDVATEFQVQGLELDYACVTWDADFRYTPDGWQHWSFRGCKWQRINKLENQAYLKNAYRVLLTRARQGMVVVVPEGNSTDHTRKSEYYNSTYQFLRDIGVGCL